MLRYLLIVFVMLGAISCSGGDWRTASREPAGIAPEPEQEKEAVIEVYAADAFGWRGWFAVHTWIALKPVNAPEYTVYEVIGWRLKQGRPVLTQYQTKHPDRYWYGSKPTKVLSVQGEKASQLIPEIKAAIQYYPWADEYSLFPGPNSNTFPAWVGLQVPALGLKMPFRAIGSGYAN